MYALSAFSFDPEVLEHWYHQARWQRIAFEAFADYLG